MNSRNQRTVFRNIVLLALCMFCIYGCRSNADVPWRPGTPLNKEKVKIGVIHISDAMDGYSYAHDKGIGQMQTAIGLSDEQILRKLNVSDADALMAEHAMRECIAEGANVIIATSWGYMDVCEKLSGEFPYVVFAHASGYKSNETNFTNYFGRVYQARYLSGIVAGLSTESDKIGYVAAMDKTNSEVTGGLNAFALGVESVNDDAKIYVRVTNSWFDPAGERQAAIRLIEEGCDVIAQHCDTSAPQLEAEKAGARGIGYNIVMSMDAPESVITSVVWDWGVYYTYLINSMIDGSFTTTPYFGGLGEGIVDIASLNVKLSTPEIERAVGDARTRILNGDSNVFDGIMETDNGQKIGISSGTLSDEEITGGIDWYYRNVIELK